MKFLINRQLSRKAVHIPDVKGSRGQAADAGCDSLNHDIFFRPENGFDEYLQKKSKQIKDGKKEFLGTTAIKSAINKLK